MSNSKTDRKRAACFKVDEMNLLIELVEKYKSVVENKETNGESWQEKKDAWRRIENEFNAYSSGCIARSTECLRNKYNLIKKTMRKKCAIIRQERLKTGGERSAAPSLDAIEKKVKSFIEKSEKELEGDFDDDDEVEVQQHPLIKTEQLAAEENNSEVIEAEFAEPVNISNNAEIDPITPKPESNCSSSSTGQLKAKKARVSRKLRKLETTSTSTMQQVIDAKLELAQLMKQELIDESKRKKEEHLLKMHAMQLDILLKKQTIGYNLK